MPSIFNFNLHKKNSEIVRLEKLNENARVHNKYLSLFKNNSLVDSLNNKNIASTSYGLVKFKNGLNPSSNYPWENFYFYNFITTESNFLRRFFYPTIANMIFNLRVSNSYVDDYQRRLVLNNFKTFTPLNNNFYYFHIKMPHEPYTYFDEFNSSLYDNELDTHVAYKNFLLEKLKPILKSKKFTNSRIVILGDHGFKFKDRSIGSSTKTSLFYKGLSDNAIDEVKSVQDLGTLIYKSF